MLAQTTMTTDKPRFRNDLVAQPLEEEGVRYVDVTDPNSGSTFRFYDVEYSIACAMDGRRDLNGLAEWTKSELGIETNVEELTGVVSTLADLGYLEAAHGASGAVEVEPDEDDDGATNEFAHSEPTRNVSREMQERARSAEASLVEIKAEAPPLGDDGTIEMTADEPAEESFEIIDKSNGGERKATRKLESRPTVPAIAMPEPPSTSPPPPKDDEDVSVDLSAHVKVGKEDVKEAVRASKVMSVPTLPSDLIDELDQEKTVDKKVPDQLLAAMAEPSRPAAVEKAPEPPRPPPPADTRRPSGAQPLPASPPKSVKPVDPPRGTPRAEPEQKSSMGMLLVLLVLALAGAGAAYYFFIMKPEQDQQQRTPQPTKGGAEPATKPGATKPSPSPAKADPGMKPQTPAKEPPAAALAEMPGKSADVAAPADGAVEWVIDADKVVKSGDVVVKLAGAKKWEAQQAQAGGRLAEYQKTLEKAKAGGNAGQIGFAQKKVDEKQGLVDEAVKNLARLTAKSSSDGKAQVLVGKGAKVKKGDPVVRIGDGAAIGAIFDAGKDAARYTAGSPCTVAAKAEKDRQMPCVVDAVDAEKVTVKLVKDAPAKAGEEVVLLPPK